jgi:hypothetical protein
METREAGGHTAFSTKDGHSASDALSERPEERTHIPRIVDDESIGNLQSKAVVTAHHNG